MDLTTARNRAINKFNKLCKKEIFCPALGKKIKFTNEGFSHITYKDKKHRRKDNEQAVRYQCFLNVETIIKKSHLYQEHREKYEEIKVRKYGETNKITKKVEYFGFVGVVEHHGVKSRIRVVVKNIDGKEHAQYHSVIPAWNTKGYRNFNGPLKYFFSKKEKVGFQIKLVRVGANTTNFFNISIKKYFYFASFFGFFFIRE